MVNHILAKYKLKYDLKTFYSKSFENKDTQLKTFNEIIKLTKDEYEEKQIEIFNSNWRQNCIGLHTFNYEHGCTVIDTRTKCKKI